MSKPLPVKAQELLDLLASGRATLSWRGEGSFAVSGPGMATRMVGPQVRTLTGRGLIGRTILTEDGLAAARIDGDAEAVRRAYRLRHAPASVLADSPLDPVPVRVIEPARARPRDGYTTHVLTDRVKPSRYENVGQDYDRWDVDVTLFIPARTWRRYSLTFYGPDAATRREYQGDLVKGVYAFATIHGVVIDNHGGTAAEHQREKDSGRVVQVRVGDVLDLRGFLFVIVEPPYPHEQHIELVRMEIGETA